MAEARPAPAPGRVSLVGAGPGDPELLTLKGRDRLREADLVLYDALVHPEVLEHCREDAETRFVGKRAGQPSIRQARINEELVEAARAGRTVVRLKGGDPFLFGRGSEEAEVLAAAGVPYEVVPGVPSPLAATAYAGLSLTHRELSSSVAYLTATEHTLKESSSHDWAKLATATQTLVVFMGMRKLALLMETLERHGRPRDTPVAIVRWASLPKQTTVVGTVGDIAEKAARAGLGLPSLIIVGEVVRLRKTLRWFDDRPLFGRRVVVTRAARQAPALVAALRKAGAEARVAPAIRLAPPTDPAALERAVASLGSYAWVLFTSANAVRTVFDALGRAGRDARAFGAARVAAIGEATGRALKEVGLVADLVPADSRGEGLLEALDAALGTAPARILLPRAEVAREVLPEGLRARGHTVDVVPAYRTLGPDVGGAEALREAVRGADAITFTSPSTVEHTLAVVGRAALATPALAAIGRVTERALVDAGFEGAVVPATPDVGALVDALATRFAAAGEEAST
ncbi:MAG: uroporphyrinogen-III C-methyltransferase [Myxococcota bacterium]